MPVQPSVGWGVLHLFYRIDRSRLDDPALAGKALAETIGAFDTDPHQALAFSVLGARADFGVMVLGPDLDRLDAFRHQLEPAVGPALQPVFGYVSLTELSEYTGDDVSEEYKQHRLYPQLPRKNLLAFYPMSKRRQPGANWFTLDFEARRQLMGGHGRVGRRYAGRILQLITGSTGLDDWEWGVTLLADDPVAIKEIVYEMRFDEVSAVYGEFGPFFLGRVLPPAELAARLGLT